MAETTARPLPMEAPIKDLGFTPEELSRLSGSVNNLTKGDLIALMDYKTSEQAQAALKLSVEDLNGLNAVVTARIQTTGGKPTVQTGGGGSGDGGIRCCCCIACCCCCCAVSVEQANAVA